MSLGQIFDETAIPEAWFDETAQDAGWFDPDLLESGISVPVARADEVDTASALSKLKVRAISRADALEEAFALRSLRARAIGRADEQDAASALALGNRIPVGIASEDDEAFALGSAHSIPVGRAEELDAAEALALVRGVVVGTAIEADLALAPERYIPPPSHIRKLRRLLDAGVAVTYSTFQKRETWAKKTADVDVIHITIGADRWELGYREFRTELNERQRIAIRSAPSSPLRAANGAPL